MNLFTRHASLLVAALIPVAIAGCIASAGDDDSATADEGALSGECASAPQWAENVTYALDALVQYQDKLYRCTLPHTSVSNWLPNVVPVLWKEVSTCSTSSGNGPSSSSSSSTTSSSSSGGGSGGAGGSTGTGGSLPTGSGLGEVLSKATFDSMFPNKNALFSYEALITAAQAFPEFCNEGSLDVRKRELAAFFGNIGHETTGGWPTAPGGAQAWGLYFAQEVGCENGQCTGYCTAIPEYPCAPGKTYHGRGPIQLSYNYNYGPVGEAIGVDLLNNPDLVTADGATSFKTAVWFWMTPQSPKPSSHDVMTGRWRPTGQDTSVGRAPGFGMTVNIINGGIECGKATPPQVEDRVAFYRRFAGMLSVDPGQNIYCNQMAHY